MDGPSSLQCKQPIGGGEWADEIFFLAVGMALGFTTPPIGPRHGRPRQPARDQCLAAKLRNNLLTSEGR